MAKTIGKYFIAIVPEGEVQEKATNIKMHLKDSYGIRYGLRSPAHVTLKMPFLWNEKKESDLNSKLRRYFSKKSPFEIHFKGVDTFGKRVIFIRVKKNQVLTIIQEDLIQYCKTVLKLEVELSDSSYTPHMTIAFKDLKERYFSEYLHVAKKSTLDKKYMVNEVALLKKDGARWAVCGTFPLGELAVDN